MSSTSGAISYIACKLVTFKLTDRLKVVLQTRRGSIFIRGLKSFKQTTKLLIRLVLSVEYIRLVELMSLWISDVCSHVKHTVKIKVVCKQKMVWSVWMLQLNRNCHSAVILVTVNSINRHVYIIKTIRNLRVPNFVCRRLLRRQTRENLSKCIGDMKCLVCM